MSQTAACVTWWHNIKTWTLGISLFCHRLAPPPPPPPPWQQTYIETTAYVSVRAHPEHFMNEKKSHNVDVAFQEMLMKDSSLHYNQTVKKI